MREIKFRAWNTITNHFSNFTNEHKISDINSNKLMIFMQYTGLKDKNGVEIYEGDIVRGGSRLWKIEISPIYGIFFILSKGDFDSYLADDFQVIGNIYENPELLN